MWWIQSQIKRKRHSFPETSLKSRSIAAKRQRLIPFRNYEKLNKTENKTVEESL